MHKQYNVAKTLQLYNEQLNSIILTVFYVTRCYGRHSRQKPKRKTLTWYTITSDKLKIHSLRISLFFLKINWDLLYL